MRTALIIGGVIVLLLIMLVIYSLCYIAAEADDWDEKHRGIRRS